MNIKKELTRLTIDLPADLHKKLKGECVEIGKSMRDLVIEAIEEKIQSLEATMGKDLHLSSV